MKQRFLSILMALCLVLSLLPTAAFAEGDNPSEPEEQQQETGGSGGAATPIAESDVIIPGGTAGTYTVSEKDGVTTVTLTGNIALTQTWTISENDSVILNLAGHTLTADEEVVAIKNEGELTIQDSGNGGKVSGLRGVDNYGNLTLEGGTITTTDNTGAGGCVFMRGDNAAFYVKGGQIKPENSSLSAIGFRTEDLSNITLSLEGGTIGNVSIKGSDYTLIIGKANGTANDVIVGDIDAATGPWVGTVSYRIELNSGTVASLPNKADSQITYRGTLGTLIQSNEAKTLPGGYMFNPVDGGYHLEFDSSANPVSIISNGTPTNYSSMVLALADLRAGDTLRLNQPYQIASSSDCIVVKVPNVTLDLNGNDITEAEGIANSPVQVNANSGTFSIKNSGSPARIQPGSPQTYTIPAVSASSSGSKIVTVEVENNVTLVNNVRLGGGARTVADNLSLDRTNLCTVQVNGKNPDNYIYSFTDLDTIASLGSADDLVTVTLLGDATTGIEYTNADVPMAINLDGHTVSAGAARNSVISIPDGNDEVNLTVENGTVNGSPLASAASVLSEKCTLVLDRLTMTSGGNFGIAANGSAQNDENSSAGLKLTVRNCSLKNSTNSQETVGIFFPAKDGTLTIEDSQITGYNVGVQAFTGTITIAGDKTEITGSGVNVPNGVEGNLKTSGPLFDGAAVSIIQRVNENGANPYGDFKAVSIEGGTFTTNTSGSSAYGALHVSKYNNNTSTGDYIGGFDNTPSGDGTKIVQVSGGTFRGASGEKEPIAEDYIVSGAKQDDNGQIVANTTSSTVATVGNVAFDDLQTAIDAAQPGGTVMLESKVIVSNQLTISEDVTIDLNHHSITGTDTEGSSSHDPVIRINGGMLTLTGTGTVTTKGFADPQRSVIIAGGSSASGNVGLEIGQNVTISAPETYGVTVFGTSNIEPLDVTIYGTITATGSRAALSGNGTDENDVTTITIKEGAELTASDYYAIYHPQYGTLNIEGGTITGLGGVQMCAGKLKITGNPVVRATGTGNLHTVDGDDGAILDGAAISLVDRDGYDSSSIEISISGGTFYATNGKDAIQAYQWSANGDDGVSGETEWSDANKHIGVSNGSFSTPVPTEYCADNFVPVTTVNDNGMYTVTKEADNGKPTVTGLTLTPKTLSLTVGNTAQLTATATVSGESSVTVTWTSDNSAVATVSSNGVVTARSAGMAKITARAGTLSLTCVVTVSNPTSTGSSSGSSDPSYSPVLDVSDGGTIKVNPRTPSYGDKVTITPDPDRGYEVGEVIVTDRSGDAVRVTANRDGTYTFTQPRGRVTIEVTFVRAGESVFFDDVPASFWAYDEIAWAYDNGYVNGTSAATFSPNSSITRQQVWMILARLSGTSPASMAAAREWAMANNISDGTNPGNAVTRQQLVALLYRYAQMMGYDNGAREALTSFPDAGTVSGYAQEPMQWSVANNIVAGTSDGTLNPTGTATRAQFAVILYRFMA